MDDLAAAVLDHDEHAAERRSILNCGPGPVDHRLCLFERRGGPDGTLRAEGDSTVHVHGDRLDYPYEYVYCGGSAFYRPRANVADGGVVPSFRRVSPETVAERDAAPADGSVVPAAVRRAVDDGSASATLTVGRGTARAERRTDRYEAFTPGLVERGGEFYRVEYSGPHARPVGNDRALTAFRVLAVCAGAALLFYAVQPPDGD